MIRRLLLPVPDVLLSPPLLPLAPSPAAGRTLTQEPLAAFDRRSLGPTRGSGRSVDAAQGAGR